VPQNAPGATWAAAQPRRPPALAAPAGGTGGAPGTACAAASTRSRGARCSTSASPAACTCAALRCSQAGRKVGTSGTLMSRTACTRAPPGLAGAPSCCGGGRAAALRACSALHSLAAVGARGACPALCCWQSLGTGELFIVAGAVLITGCTAHGVRAAARLRDAAVAQQLGVQRRAERRLDERHKQAQRQAGQPRRPAAALQRVHYQARPDSSRTGGAVHGRVAVPVLPQLVGRVLHLVRRRQRHPAYLAAHGERLARVRPANFSGCKQAPSSLPSPGRCSVACLAHWLRCAPGSSIWWAALRRGGRFARNVRTLCEPSRRLSTSFAPRQQLRSQNAPWRPSTPFSSSKIQRPHSRA